MFELPSAMFLIADGKEFRFARFYIVCEEVPLGTPESPPIVSGVSDMHPSVQLEVQPVLRLDFQFTSVCLYQCCHLILMAKNRVSAYVDKTVTTSSLDLSLCRLEKTMLRLRM